MRLQILSFIVIVWIFSLSVFAKLVPHYDDWFIARYVPLGVVNANVVRKFADTFAYRTTKCRGLFRQGHRLGLSGERLNILVSLCKLRFSKSPKKIEKLKYLLLTEAIEENEETKRALKALSPKARSLLQALPQMANDFYNSLDSPASGYSPYDRHHDFQGLDGIPLAAGNGIIHFHKRHFQPPLAEYLLVNAMGRSECRCKCSVECTKATITRKRLVKFLFG